MSSELAIVGPTTLLSHLDIQKQVPAGYQDNSKLSTGMKSLIVGDELLEVTEREKPVFHKW